MHCTHTGDYQGIRPINKRIAIASVSIAQLKDGKVLEEWAEFDLLNILNQLKKPAPISYRFTGHGLS